MTRRRTITAADPEPHFLAAQTRALEDIEREVACIGTVIARCSGQHIRAGERRLYIDLQRELDLHAAAESAWMRTLEKLCE